MAASSALTAETISAIDAGASFEMVTLSSTSSAVMGESMAETTFVASETMGSIGGGIAESAEMTAGEMANSMEASATANAALGQSVSSLSEFDESAIELSEFSPGSTTIQRQPFASTPFVGRQPPALASSVSSNFSNSLLSVLDELEEDEFEESFSQIPRTLSRTSRRTLNESTL